MRYGYSSIPCDHEIRDRLKKIWKEYCEAEKWNDFLKDVCDFLEDKLPQENKRDDN